MLIQASGLGGSEEEAWVGKLGALEGGCTDRYLGLEGLPQTFCRQEHMGAWAPQQAGLPAPSERDRHFPGPEEAECVECDNNGNTNS